MTTLATALYSRNALSDGSLAYVCLGSENKFHLEIYGGEAKYWGALTAPPFHSEMDY